jgi:photosystem II stability/assembly factor-like uncharacterized protein
MLLALYMTVATHLAFGQLHNPDILEREILSRQKSIEYFVQSDDWQRQHPIESGWRLTAVSVVDSMHAWASGWHDSAAGLVVRTTDSGKNWIELSRTLPLFVNDIHFVNDSLGWIVGGSNNQYSGYIRRTTDSGQSWTTQLIDPNNRFFSVFFLDKMRGWVCGDSGKILATTNGGTQWHEQIAGRNMGVNDIFLLPSGVGWAGGGYGPTTAFLRTTNFGLQWDSVSDVKLHQFSFASDSLGWAVTGNSWLNWKTTNGGSTWIQGSYMGPIYRTDVVALSDTLILSTMWDNRVDPPPPVPLTLLVTTNGGAYWLPAATRTAVLIGIGFSGREYGYAVGGGDIVSSADSGRTWINQVGPLREYLNSIDMIDDSVGWTVGSSELIMRTTNRGGSWTTQTPAAGGALIALSSVDREHAFAGGTFFMSTTNGGRTWTKSALPGNQLVRGLSFLDAQRGWAVTHESGVLRTVDGGVNWTQQQILPSYGLFAVDFVDSNYGWCVGKRSSAQNIFATRDGGTTWVGQPIGTIEQNHLRSVDFVDRSYGWAAGQALIVRTTNGGDRWDTSYVSPDSWFFGIKFINRDTGWAVGERGRIVATTNGGLTWIVQQAGGNPGDPDLYSVDAVSSRLVWISGESGEILHTTNGGGITAVEFVHEELPARFELEQNYPNPFNPTTTINYQLPANSHVTLKVYNVLGKEVATLVNEDRKAGYHDVTFDASQLASGMYVYRLTAGGFTASKKSLLLK